MRHGAARRRSPGQGHAVGPLLDWDSEEAETTLHHYDDAIEIESPRLEFEDEGWAPPRVGPPPLPRDPRLQHLQPFRLPPMELGREFGYRRRRGGGWLWMLVLVAAVALTLRYSPTAREVVASIANRFDAHAVRKRIDAFTTPPASQAPASTANPMPATEAAPPAAPPPVTNTPAATATPPSSPTTPTAEQRAEERRKARRAQRLARQQAAAARELPPSPSDDEPSQPAPDDAVSAPAEEAGVLRINSLPWAEVSIDGNWVGTTPQRELKLRPGRHSVRLVNPELNLTRAFDVQIGAGETVTKSVQLE